MIIYQDYIKQFINLTKNPNQLVTVINTNLKEEFGIYVSKSEKRSWINSLPYFGKLLENDLCDKRRVLIEFNVPTTKKRIDIVVLGNNLKKMPSAWIIELKQWSKFQEIDRNKFFIIRKYYSCHPSEQAYEYQNILENYLGLKDKIIFYSSAFLHNLNDQKSISLLRGKHYQKMIKLAWLYAKPDEKILIRKIFDHTYTNKETKTLDYFKDAEWSPSKNFQEIIQSNLKSIELLGSQNRIYNTIIDFIKNNDLGKKQTFIVSGDPGSGKTIIAFKILNFLIANKQTQLMIPGQEFRKAIKEDFKRYKSNLSNFITGAALKKDSNSVIIDEAHKAVGRDTGKINYQRIYQKIELAIIFIDDDQIINKKGINLKQIEKIAQDNNHSISKLNIDENFRNNGERTLLDWIDCNIYNRKITFNDFEYKQKYYINKNQKYKLRAYENADNFLKVYYQKWNSSEKTRIVSFWSEGYYNKKADKNGFPLPSIFIGNDGFIWNTNEEWSKVVKKNHGYFKTYNRKVKKYVLNSNKLLTDKKIPKNFIAYFNHIQGYEFENIFVFIPKKVLTYDEKQKEIIFHREGLAKEVKISQTWSYKNGKKEYGKAYQLNKKYFLNRLKVMLTRGTKSTHFFAEDKSLNNFLRKRIKN